VLGLKLSAAADLSRYADVIHPLIYMNLIQAWFHWFSGNKLDENTTVCAVLCWKLLVWARWGKIIQLISATTIIADIIGPEKLRETGESLLLIIRRIAWLLERPKVENLIKIISLIFLLVGFHFDLLAS
jgi:hypothetical protein